MNIVAIKVIKNAKKPFSLFRVNIKQPNLIPNPKLINTAGSSNTPWGKSLHKTTIPASPIQI